MDHVISLGNNYFSGAAQVVTAASTAPSTAVGAAYSPVSTDGALTDARIRELTNGAQPINQAEAGWLRQQKSTILQTIAGTVQAMINSQAGAGQSLVGYLNRNTEDHQFEQRVVELVNAERSRYGLGALRYNGRLDFAAEGHNAQQVRTMTMAHDGIGDATPGDRIRAAGFGNSWGENVATGQTSPEQVVAEWMASPGHRENILRGNFTQIGVSYMTAPNGRTYWAQEFGAG